MKDWSAMMQRRPPEPVVRLLVAALLCGPWHGLLAQAPGRRVEVYGTVGGIVGVTPVRVEDVSHLGAHGGLRLDAGLQGARNALAAGIRLWELVPTASYGGHGLDLLVQLEHRLGASTRTSARATVGGGFDEIDPGRGPYRENTGTSGVVWSVGVGHELVLPSGGLALLSVDLVVPTVNADVGGRRLSVIELGFGYRFRRYTEITMPTPAGPRSR